MFKFILGIFVVALFFNLSLLSADLTTLNPTDTNKTIDSKQISVSGLTLEVSTAEAIQWKQESNSFTPEYKSDTYYNIVKDGKIGGRYHGN